LGIASALHSSQKPGGPVISGLCGCPLEHVFTFHLVIGPGGVFAKYPTGILPPEINPLGGHPSSLLFLIESLRQRQNLILAKLHYLRIILFFNSNKAL
jgi:hypothetical protein